MDKSIGDNKDLVERPNEAKTSGLHEHLDWLSTPLGGSSYK